jgi:hypothetical protein
MDKEWSTSGKYLSIPVVEEGLGERLRLQQYKDCFADNAVATELAVSLAENQNACTSGSFATTSMVYSVS